MAAQANGAELEPASCSEIITHANGVEKKPIRWITSLNAVKVGQTMRTTSLQLVIVAIMGVLVERH
jgi:hypothetical protein